MLKYRWKDWDERQLNRLLVKGRGQGVLKSYTPFIKVGDFPSGKGERKRVRGSKIDRVHHTLSSHERNLLYLLEWMDCVIDIREQFPLLDLDLACLAAEEAGIRYPRDNKTKFPYVLTTDFRVTVSNEGKEFEIGLTVKPSSKLQIPRVLELYEIERRYYDYKNTPWFLVTEEHIPKLFANNIKFFRANFKLEATQQKTIEELRSVIPHLKQKVNSFINENCKVSLVTKDFDSEWGLKGGTSLALIKHLVASKEIILDMDKCDVYKNFSTDLIKEIIF